MAQVTIIGLNTIGMSLGLALRKTEQTLTIVGVDREFSTGRTAQQNGSVERVERWADQACKNAGLVILCEPLAQTHETLERIAPVLQQGTVVTDTAPLMAPVLQWADELLPEGVSFIAGHPILDPGKAENIASSELFQGAQFCIAPSSKAKPEAMDMVSAVVALVGAQPFFLDPAEHDGLITAVEALPALLGTTLMGAAAGASSWHDMRRMAGPRFAHATASADLDPTQVAAELRANRENLARWLETFRARLAEVRAALLDEDEERLASFLANAREARENWLNAQHSGNWDNAPEMPKMSVASSLSSMIWPRKLTDEVDKKQDKRKK